MGTEIGEGALAAFKAAQRDVWELGDYRPIARRLDPAAHLLVTEAGVRAGHRVLDIGTGSGSVAIAAARAGASVVGVDITDAWFPEARRRAQAADVDVDLRLGDAESLPVEDASFDVVLSSFAVIFAPRHDVVAAEMARVCRSGGVVALTAWTPDSATDRMFAVAREHLPDPPAFADSYARWGDPAYVRERFADHGVAFRFRRSALHWDFVSEDAAFAFLLAYSGPLIATRDALMALGRWDEVRTAMRDALAEANDAGGGACRLTMAFLCGVGDTARRGR